LKGTKKIMKKLNYFKIIQKYIDPNSLTYSIYIPHVILVTNKALAIARGLNLSSDSLRFIEEAGMLHDIGVVEVKSEKLQTTGRLPYICHGNQGRVILENEGLPQHALVAERHTGVGISASEITARNLPLPVRDMLAQSVEERIISYADLFFSKRPEKLWIQESVSEIEEELAEYGVDQVETFRSWHHLYSRF
jgi:uncharacterized protein